LDGGPILPEVETTRVLVNPTSFPTVWNGVHRYMMPGLFAAWSDSRKTYQLVQVNRDTWPHLLFTCTETQRSSPFYFAQDTAGPDLQSRTISVYRPRARIHTHMEVGVWFTGGWLCKRNGNTLHPVIPLMGISDARVIQYGKKNPGMYLSEEYLEWQNLQSSAYTIHILRNRLPAFVAPSETVETKPTASVLPAFVARALLRDAMSGDQTCPITMEALEEGAASVTSCFHVFSRDALAEWVARQGASCPVCKQKCTVTEI
jgi:hypothetical protein